MARIELWLQLENQPWDLAPNGIDRATGESFTRDTSGMFKPLSGGALIFRRCAPNWTAPADVKLNPWDLNELEPALTRGTIPGATIELKVGDEAIIHFRNMDMRAGFSESERTHSLHAHGVQHSVMYDGTYPISPPDPSQGNKQGDRVPPGGTFDYLFTVPHLSNAGVWMYHDHSMAAASSIARGAFGAIVVLAGGESRPILPTQPLRVASDSATHFANVPVPPAAGAHLFFLHELAGVGECLNGHQRLGNTPSVIARTNTRVKFRVLNLTNRAQSFHLHGHRWKRGDDWVDTEVVGVGGGMSFEVLEGTAETGGGNGEWMISSPTSEVCGSLIVTDGGALSLPIGAAA
ncbi:MAG: hypothetical protein EYC68_05485 [Chloroflexota bacterium]|nr:MAG: hypothetical protein EYC68_05485 [Chloroflexota bacterium]